MENQNVTQSQSLMMAVNHESVVQQQIQTIVDAGFVPVAVNVTRHVYQKLKADYCAKHNIVIDSDECNLQLVKYQGLPLRVLEADSNFNNHYMNGYIFPIQVTMTLPEPPVVEEAQSEENDESNG